MCRAQTPCCAMRNEEHPRAERLQAAARSLVGVRFRPQGRSPHGCDCLGLGLQVAWAAGIRIDVRPLPMRGLGITDGVALLRELGCSPVTLARTGDLLLGAPATLQLHLACRVEGGIVEAHAGLRRVVLRPLSPGERWHSAWRLPVGDG